MSCFSDHVFFISYLLFCFHFLSYVYSVTKKGISVNTEIPFSRKCRRPESNRHGRLVPQDFKSCASASSATAAYPFSGSGWRWIRTTESTANRFTVCPLWPLGNPSILASTSKNYIIIPIIKMQEVFLYSCNILAMFRAAATRQKTGCDSPDFLFPSIPSTPVPRSTTARRCGPAPPASASHDRHDNQCVRHYSPFHQTASCG